MLSPPAEDIVEPCDSCGVLADAILAQMLEARRLGEVLVGFWVNQARP